MPKRAGTKNRNLGKVEYRFQGKVHILEQRLDGIHARVRYARDGVRVIPFEHVLSKPEAERPEEHHKLNGKTIEMDLSTLKARVDLADELLCAAEDLKALARELSGGRFDPSVLYPDTKYRLEEGHLRDASEQVRKAFRLIRSITAANLRQQP